MKHKRAGREYRVVLMRNWIRLTGRSTSDLKLCAHKVCVYRGPDL